MFAGVQKYMAESGTEVLTGTSRAELVQKLLHQGIKRPELKDELYMQLLKQSRGNTTPSNVKVCPCSHVLHLFMCRRLDQHLEIEHVFACHAQEWYYVKTIKVSVSWPRMPVNHSAAWQKIIR